MDMRAASSREDMEGPSESRLQRPLTISLACIVEQDAQVSEAACVELEFTLICAFTVH